MSDETSPSDDDSTDAPADADAVADAVADVGEAFADGDALADAEQAIADARRRLAEVPAHVVVTNHAMGLYELAAIHLSASPPDLVSAALAIDALGALVDGLGDRLGPETPTMRDALANIRVAFVQIKGAQTVAAEPGDATTPDAP